MGETSVRKLCLACVAVLFCLCAAVAWADGGPSNSPSGTYGAITLGANVATAVPASPMAGRYAISVQNLDSAAVYCGWDSSVSATNGYQVPASGGTLSVNVSYDANLGRATLYCLSVAGQSGNNNLRWMEVR